MLNIMGILGLAGTVVGTIISMQGQKQQQAAQIQQIEAFKEGEAARRKQMQLDAARRRREIIREGIVARSQALASAVGAGAMFGSTLQGAYGQISGQTGRAAVDVDQNLTLGENVFAANARGREAQIAEAKAGGKISLGNGLVSLGGSLMNSSSIFERVGTYATSRR